MNGDRIIVNAERMEHLRRVIGKGGEQRFNMLMNMACACREVETYFREAAQKLFPEEFKELTNGESMVLAAGMALEACNHGGPKQVVASAKTVMETIVLVMKETLSDEDS